MSNPMSLRCHRGKFQLLDHDPHGWPVQFFVQHLVNWGLDDLGHNSQGFLGAIQAPTVVLAILAHRCWLHPVDHGNAHELARGLLSAKGLDPVLGHMVPQTEVVADMQIGDHAFTCVVLPPKVKMNDTATSSRKHATHPN